MTTVPRPLPFNSIFGLFTVSLGVSMGVSLAFYFADPDARLPNPWTLGEMTLTIANTFLLSRDYYDAWTERWRLPFPKTTAVVLFMTIWLAIFAARAALEKAFGHA